MFTVSHFPYGQPHTASQQDSGTLYTAHRLCICDSFAGYSFAPPKPVAVPWSPVSLCKAGKQWPCAARLQVPGSILTPKQRPRQGLFSVVFMHLCPFEEVVV